MADYLDQIANDQLRQDSRDVADARANNTWASTFASTPPAEVLRARTNYADAVNRAITNKIALQSRGDAHAMEVMQKTAKFKEYMAQAPLREKLLNARIEATGATERRKAAEATMGAEQTANLNRGMMDFYAQGGRPGTPEAQQTFLGLVADNPMAHPGHLAEIGKSNGFGDLPPEELAAKAAALKKAATDAGLSNVAIGSNKSGLTLREQKAAVDPNAVTDALVNRKAALQALDKTPEQKTAEAVDRAKAIAKAKGLSPSVTNLYSEKLGEISGLQEQEKGETDVAKKAEIAAKRVKNEELIRSLESIHPDLRASRGIPGIPVPAASATAPVTQPATVPAAPVPIAGGSAIATKADYDALPAGSEFIWNGKKGRKP